MEQLNNDTLPCLNAVGPWWTDEDRRTLFCHLMSIFHFDENYLTTLPASLVQDSLDTYRMEASSIKSDYRLFEKSRSTKKINCSSIRKISFSFGKYNHRLCFLCPYSTTYRNSNRSSETRFLYHLMNHGAASLESYLNTSDKELSQYFSSYFPIYINNTLIDAYPFDMVASKFLEISSDYFFSAPLEARHLLVNKLAKDLNYRISFAKLRPLINITCPDINDNINKLAIETVKSIEYENYNTRSINELLLKRLFKSLAEENKYKPKSTTDYLSKVLEPLNPELFQSKILFSQEEFQKIDSFYEISIANEIFHNQDLFKQLDLLPILDDPLLSSDIEQSLIEATAIPSVIAAPERKSLNTAVINTIDEASDTSQFWDYYKLQNSDGICILGSNDSANYESIFKAMISNTQYLCIEPCLFNDEGGIIILNDTNDLLFYPTSKLGNRMLRKLSEQDIPVYTSNIYHTGCLLFSNSCFYIKLKDIGIASAIVSNTIPKGILDITTTPFPECMKEYESIYKSLIEHAAEHLLKDIDLYESFKYLLCIDGIDLPFKNIKFLYELNDAIDITYNFTKDINPISSGLILSLTAYLNNIFIENNILIKLYMEICIELHKHFPFFKNNLFLLSLSEEGILFFMSGSKKQLQKIRLFLSSCARRIFSKYSTKDNPITFEEKSHLYENAIEQGNK